MWKDAPKNVFFEPLTPRLAPRQTRAGPGQSFIVNYGERNVPCSKSFRILRRAAALSGRKAHFPGILAGEKICFSQCRHLYEKTANWQNRLPGYEYCGQLKLLPHNYEIFYEFAQGRGSAGLRGESRSGQFLKILSFQEHGYIFRPCGIFKSGIHKLRGSVEPVLLGGAAKNNGKQTSIVSLCGNDQVIAG